MDVDIFNTFFNYTFNEDFVYCDVSDNLFQLFRGIVNFNFTSELVEDETVHLVINEYLI